MFDFLQQHQTVIHYAMHFAVPGLLAYLLFRNYWKQAWGIMIATMLVDLDHLLATPLFDPNRCGIGFHPLHTMPAMLVYVYLILIPNKFTRIIGIGLLFHMLTDWIDCLLM